MLQRIPVSDTTPSVAEILLTLSRRFYKAHNTHDLFFRVALWYLYQSRKKHRDVPAREQVCAGVSLYVMRFSENESIPHYMNIAYERVIASNLLAGKNSSRK